jgi:hypothetical protein
MRKNIHVHDGVNEAEFVVVCAAPDKTLDMPKLTLPAVQVNIRAGALPPSDEDGISHLRLPVNAF